MIMLSKSEQAAANLREARALRATGRSYREIRALLGLSAAQLGHLRRALKREKAARTRLRATQAQASEGDWPVRQSVLPLGLRKILASSGYRTLGDLAARLADPELPGLETLPGVGPHRARMVQDLLDSLGLFEGSNDLQSAIEHLFPEFLDPAADEPDRLA
jgi:hypothetical protein